jgi:histidine ammonia-lyase
MSAGAGLVVLKPGQVGLADWLAIYRGAEVALDPACAAAIEASARRGGHRRQGRARLCSINTGFGKPPASHRGA